MVVLTAESLIASLPPGVVVTDPATCENYRHDWSRDPGAGLPLAVVRPTDADQVQATLRWAAEHSRPSCRSRSPIVGGLAEVVAISRGWSRRSTSGWPLNGDAAG